VAVTRVSWLVSAGSPDRTQPLETAASAVALLVSAAAGVYVLGDALVALRLHALGFSTSTFAASQLPHDYAFEIALREVLWSAPWGALIYAAVWLLNKQKQRMPRCRRWVRILGLAATLPTLALLLWGHTWLDFAAAVGLQAVALLVLQHPIARVVLALAVSAAIVVASELDRTGGAGFEQAVLIFRPDVNLRDVTGSQVGVTPVFDGSDPLCQDEQRQHLCGLLLQDGGSTITLASLAFEHMPRVVDINRDEVASVFVVATQTRISEVEATFRRTDLRCRLPLLRELWCKSLPPPAPIGPPPTASDGMTVGSTLSAVKGTWSGTPRISYAYQWQRCSPGFTNIAGATGASYRLSAADAGIQVRVVITATNVAGSTTVASACSPKVAAP
jgi:hypothetical protein